MKRDHSRISPIKHEGKLATGFFEKAEALNAQFHSVFINEGDTEIPDKGTSPHPTLTDYIISTDGISKLINNLEVNKAVGPDNISTRILKELSEHTAPILATIFQKSLDSGIVHNDWKQANLVPLFKKGERLKPQITGRSH